MRMSSCSRCGPWNFSGCFTIPAWPVTGLKRHRTLEGGGADRATSLRLFRNAPEIRYRYPIFEQLEPSSGAVGGPGRLGHCRQRPGGPVGGNDPADGNRRRERNLRILRKAMDAHPGEPYFPYKLACEGMTLLDDEVLPVAGLNRSLGYLNQAWRKVAHLPAEQRQALSWLPDLGVRVARGC